MATIAIAMVKSSKHSTKSSTFCAALCAVSLCQFGFLFVPMMFLRWLIQRVAFCFCVRSKKVFSDKFAKFPRKQYRFFSTHVCHVIKAVDKHKSSVVCVYCWPSMLPCYTWQQGGNKVSQLAAYRQPPQMPEDSVRPCSVCLCKATASGLYCR